MSHIWLIGMMGSGKTTIGAIVAERLELPLVDTDGMVMERSGRTIPEIFDESEEAFRNLEAGVVREVADGPAAVISTGGGVVVDDRNVALMRSSGVTLLLDASIDELVARIGMDEHRPLVPVTREPHRAARPSGPRCTPRRAITSSTPTGDQSWTSLRRSFDAYAPDLRRWHRSVDRGCRQGHVSRRFRR